MKFRRFAACLLLLAIAAQLAGCGNGSAPTLLTPPKSAVDAAPVTADVPKGAFAQAADNFSVRLLQETHQAGENTTLSPYSVLTALAMAANGADGETRSQMEDVLGLPVDQLNAALYECRQLPTEALVSANSFWIRNGLDVQPDFLQAGADYYDASVYQTDFDGAAVDAVNGWIAEHTMDRIKKMVEEFPPLTMLCLINALTFDAKWLDEFSEDEIRPADFHAANGETRQVDMMYDSESYYISTDTAAGFIKPYSDGRFSFVALLPNEDITIEDYVNQLTGDALRSIVSTASREEVVIGLPVFRAEYSAELSGALMEMGMPLAFDVYNADLSRIADTKPPLYISEVLHKTYVSVDGSGTEAAAATAIMLAPGEAVGMPEPKRVVLDRPFVWMIWDEQTAQPIFLGITNDITK